MLLRSVALACLLVVLGAGSAQADVFYFSDSFDPVDVFFTKSGDACTGDPLLDTISGAVSGSCSSLTYTYTLDGYDPATDTLNSAYLDIAFYDDGDKQAETFDISIDSLFWNDVKISSGSTSASPFIGTYGFLTELASDGQVTVTISLQNGDGYFASNKISVSEPSSFLLFVAGLAALGIPIYRRRKK